MSPCATPYDCEAHHLCQLPAFAGPSERELTSSVSFASVSCLPE